MGEYVLTLLAAAAVTYLLTPAVRRFAIAIGALHAARERDVHVVPTPLLGGFAMYAGLAAGLLVASRMPALTGAFAEPNMSKGLLLAGGLVVIMGFVDDRWGLSALSKLAGQVAAGVILVWSGAEVTWLPLPGGGTFGLTTDQQTAATILVVVVTINAINFIDGLDGLAAGIVGIGAAAFFVYYYTLTHRLGLPDQTGPALAAAVIVGICLGFLPHNFYPARIFMGDTGAMLLGLLLAYAPISSLASLDPASLTDHAAFAAGTVNRFGEFLPLLVPAAIMLIPYADLLMAVIRRTRAGTSVFSPDKKHLQHRLLAIGHSHRGSVLIMYLWAALFAGGVVWLSIVRTSLYVLIIVTGAAVLALALLLVSMPRLRPWARAKSAEAAAGPPSAGAVAEPVVQPEVAEPRSVWAGSGQAAATWSADSAPSPPSAWTEPIAAPAPVTGRPPAPVTGRPPAPVTGRRPAPPDFPAAEVHAAAAPADLEDTGPIPPMSGPAARTWPPLSGSGSGSVLGGSSASPFGSTPEPGEPPEPVFGSGPGAGQPPESAFRSGPGAGQPPEPVFGSGPGAGEQPEPAFEPAPWPGFAPEEPAAGDNGGPGPAASARPAQEPASWFEPAPPGKPNGSAAPDEPAPEPSATPVSESASWFGR
jgi:UDP-GlcNAc:undecaprenyl-phosphate GlcNAc-1-phosphate transferase